jgi:hypothetical protein
VGMGGDAYISRLGRGVLGCRRSHLTHTSCQYPSIILKIPGYVYQVISFYVTCLETSQSLPFHMSCNMIRATVTCSMEIGVDWSLVRGEMDYWVWDMLYCVFSLYCMYCTYCTCTCTCIFTCYWVTVACMLLVLNVSLVLQQCDDLRSTKKQTV